MDKLPRPHRILFLLTVILVLISARATWLSAQDKPAADAQNKPQPPTFVVRGRVVYDHTDRPVRRSQILLMQSFDRPGSQHTSATDRDGRFLIPGVPPGIYFAFINSPGIITPLGFTTVSAAGPPEGFDLKALREYCTEIVVESSDVDITVRARRGGAISGKITYFDGEAAVNAEIAVVRRKANQTTRVITGLNAASLLSLQTDDRGRYRISGLPPGEYIVSAAEKNTSPKSSNRDYGLGGLFGSGDALTISYYGGGTKIDDALKLQVEARTELTDIDITLPDLTPYTVRGSVIAKLDRIPLPGATIGIRNKDHQPDWLERGGRQIPTDDQGQWVADGVPDGTYVLRVEPPTNIPVPGATPLPTPAEDEDARQGRPQVPTRQFVPTEVQLVVAGGDVVLEPTAVAEGGSISGTIDLPNTIKEAPGFYMMLVWKYEGEIVSSHTNSKGVFEDRFTIDGLREGKLYLNAMFSPYGSSDNDSSRYYLKSIDLNGADVTNKPISIKEGQSVTGLRIVISDGVGKASVKLVTAEGKPANARRLAIVPVEPSRWLFDKDLVGVSDSQGQASFTCAPGEYFVVVSSAEEAWPPTYDSIKQRSADAPRIKVSSGENKTFVISLSLTGSQNSPDK